MNAEVRQSITAQPSMSMDSVIGIASIVPFNEEADEDETATTFEFEFLYPSGSRCPRQT
jgi:hypothetical protein